MAINNYINLERNDFFSPYLDGISNLKKAFSPQSTTNIYNSDRTITLIPFSLEDRVCHFVSGIALMIPVVNLVISCALRYFATQNLPAVRSTASAHTAILPTIATSQVLPSAPTLAVIVEHPDQRDLPDRLNTTHDDRDAPKQAGSNVSESQGTSSAAGILSSAVRPQLLPLVVTAESRSAVINSALDQSSLVSSLDTSHNDRNLTAPAASDISEPQHASPAGSTLQRNQEPPAARLHVLSSPEALRLVALRRAAKISIPSADLLVIPEEGGEEEEPLHRDSSPSAPGPITRVAGVLPYRLHLGEVEILIGRNRADGKWSCFGGDYIGDEPPIRIAARKCDEVTGGFLGSQSVILPHLSESDSIGEAYKTYFMKVGDRSITAGNFLGARKAVAKIQIAWVKIQDLLSVARNAHNRLKIQGSQAGLDPSFRATLQSPSSQDVLRRISRIQSSGRLHGVSSFASERSGKVA